MVTFFIQKSFIGKGCSLYFFMFLLGLKPFPSFKNDYFANNDGLKYFFLLSGCHLECSQKMGSGGHFAFVMQSQVTRSGFWNACWKALSYLKCKFLISSWTPGSRQQTGYRKQIKDPCMCMISLCDCIILDQWPASEAWEQYLQWQSGDYNGQNGWLTELVQSGLVRKCPSKTQCCPK